ncbi:unnamed protein product [Ilex paraguariensis]|uniref:AP2/ERF domain-containing protein n=1 Tax=Ilex paraguariensis TaxID=185542 RepID=A0ABC8TUX7_9AQUA
MANQKKYKGVRCRKWGKWVSEIRVPGTKERLWLGSYSTPEAAAVAHDIAYYCLRGPSLLHNLNFPSILPATAQTGLSPRSIQKAASDAGMAIDAQFTIRCPSKDKVKVNEVWSNGEDSSGSWEASVMREGEALNISVEDYI